MSDGAKDLGRHLRHIQTRIAATHILEDATTNRIRCREQQQRSRVAPNAASTAIYVHARPRDFEIFINDSAGVSLKVSVHWANLWQWTPQYMAMT
jgi:hypothetical protein